MSSASSKILMLGLPDTGKTTFLAALWHCLESGELLDGLRVPTLQPDRDYLNGIRDSWLALKSVGRTSSRATTSVTLSLDDTLNNTPIEVTIPDQSGELFSLQWTTRKARASYASFARECSGAFLFIHPKEIRVTHPIKESRTGDGELNEDEERKIDPSPNWSPEQSSTQVQLVDLLQLFLGMREISEPLRLAIMISAWDLVRARVSPAGWLEHRLQLLSQFLRANATRFGSEVFGVSAQGGDLSKDRAALISNLVPSTRPKVMQGDSLESANIMAPLRFLLGISPNRTAKS